MSKNASTKAERQLQNKKDSRIGWLLIIIGMIALIAFVYSAREYYLTVIQFKYILLGCLVPGLTIGTLTLQYSRRIHGKSVNAWAHYLWAAIVYGSIAWGIFFWTNSHLSKSPSYVVKAAILERLETIKYHHIHVRVNINDLEKDIPMPNADISEVNNSNFVLLTFKKGFWGPPFILDRQLSKN
jgi:hypothetical protein